MTIGLLPTDNSANIEEITSADHAEALLTKLTTPNSEESGDLPQDSPESKTYGNNPSQMTEDKDKPAEKPLPPFLTYDLETYPHLFLYIARNSETSELTIHYITSDTSETECFRILSEINAHTNVLTNQFVGYNSSKFDDPIIRVLKDYLQDKLPTAWSTLHPTQLFYTAAQQFIEHDKSELTRKYRNDTRAPRSIDLMALLNPMPSLKKVEIRNRHHNVQDLPFAHDHDTPFTEQEIQTVIEYCINDVDATEGLLTKAGVNAYKLRLRLQEKYALPPKKLESLSEPQTAEQIMIELYCNENDIHTGKLRNQAEDTVHKYTTTGSDKQHIDVSTIIPDWIEFDTDEMNDLLEGIKSQQIEVKDSGHPDTSILKHVVTIGNKQYQMGGGGLHSVDDARVIRPRSSYHHIVDVDVASYYPAIMINNRLHPEHLNENWVDLYTTIRDERLVAKRSGNKVDANALKIVINSLFGKTSSRYSPFYDPAMMLSVTLTGQLALLMLIEQFDLFDIEVLSANTDGITVEYSDGQRDFMTKLCKNWENETNFELEEIEYKALARRDVNNYCALTIPAEGGSSTIKRKGIFTRPSIKHDVKASIVQRMVEEHLLEQKPLAIPSDVTIYDFLYHFSATKEFQPHFDDMTGYRKEMREWTVQLKDGTVKSKFQNPPPKNIHPDHPDPIVHPELPTASRTPLQKSNRSYISNNPALRYTVIRKTGGKNNSTVTVPNSERAVIMNKIDNPDLLPDDLDYEYYLDQARELIETITG